MTDSDSQPSQVVDVTSIEVLAQSAVLSFWVPRPQEDPEAVPIIFDSSFVFDEDFLQKVWTIGGWF